MSTTPSHKTPTTVVPAPYLLRTACDFQVSTKNHIHTSCRTTERASSVPDPRRGPHRVNTIRRKDQSLPRLGPKRHSVSGDRKRARPRSQTRHPFYIIQWKTVTGIGMSNFGPAPATFELLWAFHTFHAPTGPKKNKEAPCEAQALSHGLRALWKIRSLLVTCYIGSPEVRRPRKMYIQNSRVRPRGRFLGCIPIPVSHRSYFLILMGCKSTS
jgi:hypothetical protein